jgi:hypothetical protein
MSGLFGIGWGLASICGESGSHICMECLYITDEREYHVLTRSVSQEQIP